jgi:hypothetical protein
MRQDTEKVAVAEIRNFTFPQPLHASKIHIFENDDIACRAKVAGQIPVSSFSLMKNTAVLTGQIHMGPCVVRRSFDLARLITSPFL